MYILNEICLVAVITYTLWALDISTLSKMTFGLSAISEMKHKHQTASPNASKIDGSNNTKHINNVLYDVLHHNNTDYCQSSDAADGRCNTDINWKNNSKTHLFQQVDDWIEVVKNAEMKELSDEIGSSAYSVETTSNDGMNTLYSIADCKSRGVIWNYKYIGAKKKNKMFYGQGELSFTISSSPPHGYDYGIISGHCLRMTQENQNGVESIKGHFNKDGSPSGHGIRIKYRNGTFLKATMIKGVIHGLVLERVVQLDPDTNQSSIDSSVLSKIPLYKNGEEDKNGYAWILMQNGIKIQQNKDLDSKTIVVLPKNPTLLSGMDHLHNNITRNYTSINANKYIEVISGKLDLKDNVILNAKRAELIGSQNKNNILVIDTKEKILSNNLHEDLPSSFPHYNLETTSWTNAVSGKLARFIDTITDSKKMLKDYFKTIPVSCSSCRRIHVMQTTGRSEVEKHFSFLYLHFACPYDRKLHITAKVRKNELDKEGELSGTIELQIVTNMRKKDLKEESNYTKTHPGSNTHQQVIFDRDVLDKMVVQRTDQPINKDNGEKASDNELLIYRKYPYLFESSEIVKSIKASFHKGKVVDGTVITIKFTDSSKIEGFVQNNSFHGTVRFLDAPLASDRILKRYSQYNHIEEGRNVMGLSQGQQYVEVNHVAVYKNGFPDGPSWTFMPGSLLYTNSDHAKHGQSFFGSHIHNDFSASYVGTFENGKMIFGHLANVVGHEEIDQIRVPRFSNPISETMYHSIDHSYLKENDLETNSSWNSPLFVTDPIEDKWVYVNQSRRATNMYSKVEDGLFAKINIPTNEVIAFFGGFRYSKQTWEDMKLFDPVYFRPLYMEPGIYLI